MHRFVIALVAGLSLTAVARAAENAPFYPPAGLDMTGIDPDTRPGDDYFQHANGGWLARTVIPPDKPLMTEAQAVRDRIEAQLHELLESAAAHASPDPADLEGKVGAFYASFMDVKRRDVLGARPLAAELTAIRGSRSRADLARILGRCTRDFGGCLFQPFVDVDLKDTEHYAVYLTQAGLTMPDRDYYLEASFAEQKSQFGPYVRHVLELIHWPMAEQRSGEIVALETRIAQASWSKAEQRDLLKTYNPYTPAELQAFAPDFPWAQFIQGAGLTGAKRLVVAEQTAFPKIAAVFRDTPLATLKAWAAFTAADAAAPYLSDPFAAAHFAFHDHALLGVKQRPPLWKEGVKAVSGGDCLLGLSVCFGTLNWAVGQLYTARHFPPASKAGAEALAAELMKAFRTRIEHLDWMTEATRAEALRKLDTYVIKVGYPEHQRDYSHVAVRNDDVVGNVRRAAQADWEFYVTRSAGPVDKTDWTMTPQTLDAYNGGLRDIVFPAAILQPPDFDPAADPAVNFGGIGMIIGHELTHGFDDQGRLLDVSGNLRNWWTDADDHAFKERAAVLGAQYAAFEPVPGAHIKPELTMGENIADLGGVLIALDAYHNSLHGAPAPVIDGLSGDQRFFQAFAQSWRGKASDDYIRNQVSSDPHSYRKFRVNGPLRNIDAWYEAFAVKEGDKLFIPAAQRARIW
ncbi:MAG: M13 family metallopeptidase [Gammaproteobacteria bacterium]|nr:M13 family metallopeptidase [Gammaproteobacteria bacterium]